MAESVGLENLMKHLEGLARTYCAKRCDAEDIPHGCLGVASPKIVITQLIFTPTLPDTSL